MKKLKKKNQNNWNNLKKNQNQCGINQEHKKRGLSPLFYLKSIISCSLKGFLGSLEINSFFYNTLKYI